MKKNNVIGFTSLIIVLVIAGTIFYSSSQPYGKQTLIPVLETSLSTKPFEDVLMKVEFTYGSQPVSIAKGGYYHFIEFFIRKAAHFSIYFIMGMIYILILHSFRVKKQLIWVLSPITLSLFAVTDEWHQSFTVDRTPLVSDVILDSIGALLGILLMIIILRIRKKRQLS
ncbi:VanZ family protein [Brochothrix thermosphacta]|uniref:VanZ family protein n=1 Tax=Brochothrix thermosphacta TaxID=2756 RepID=UPI001C4ED213|nr:VanZ family protein [Brochothrix thermosphacta]